MSVISLTITPSADGVVRGIPATVSITTNVPATIFYTLDGTVPDTFSSIYFTPIVMPTEPLTLVLSCMAGNGIDTTSVVSQTFTGDPSSLPTIVGDRLPHAAVTNVNVGGMGMSLFPYGTGGPSPTFQYLNPGSAGTTVYNQSLPATSVGFDARGQPDGYSNAPYSSFGFRQVYSTTNDKGEVFPGVGNLPAKTTIIGNRGGADHRQERSSTADKLFNPKAMVIYQDSSTEDPTNPVIINKQFFSAENAGIVRDGALLYATGLDNPTTTGSYVKSHFNPRTQQTTAYFYDNAAGKWIISTSPYNPTNRDVGRLDQIVYPREKGAQGRVFAWHLWQRRTLM